MNKIPTILAIISGLFLVFIIFGVIAIGDRNCRIQIQNGGQGQLILKTFQLTNYDNKLTVDSVVLEQNEKIEIGHCISCSTPDTLDIDFDAIGFYDKEGTFRLMNRKEMVKYLETKQKHDCITYIIE